MKINLLLLIFIASAYAGHSQERLVPYLHLSPLEKSEIPIGLVNCKLEYSRPSMRGRKIFGDLVPFDTLWRFGANKNSKITFDDDVIIGDYLFTPGAYTAFILPRPKTWTVYFYEYIDYYGIPRGLDTLSVLLELEVPVLRSDRTEETMSIDYQNITYNAAELCITWENSQVRIPIQIPLKDNIENRLSANRLNLSSDYATAVQILYGKEKNTEESFDYINKSIKLLEGDQTFEAWIADLDSDDFGLPWGYYILSQMYADLNNIDMAISSARRSIRIAKIVNSKYYERENKANLAKWEK